MDAPTSELLLRIAAGALIGAIAGSFLATVLIRAPAGRSALVGRSICDACGTRLSPGELVPLLSFLLQRGRCRRCAAPIDMRHPLMEAGAALVGAVALAAHGGALGFVTAVFGWWLLLIAAIDAEHHWLPDRLTLPLGAAGLLAALGGLGPALIDRATGAGVGYAVLAALALTYRRLRGREGLGGGDPKLLAAIGAWLGWQALPLVLLGAALAGLAALALRRLRGQRIAATDRLPLGTLMALAAWPLWLVTAG